jgi:hypothetical protein
MIGAIAGQALKLGGTIAGGISSMKAMRQVQADLARRQRENQDWYNMRYNEDATQRADAQRVLEMTRQAIQNRNRQAAATQAVMGGTNESVAAERAANAQAMSDAASQIALAGDKRKDAIENQYMTQRDKLADAQNELRTQKAQAVQQMATEMGNTGNSIANILGKS